MNVSDTDAQLASALRDQSATLSRLSSVLEDAIRATAPAADAQRWAGPARTAYDAALTDVRGALRGLGDCLGSADSETVRAMHSVAGRVR